MDSTLACLSAWMPRQRWYAGKGRRPSLRLVASWGLDPHPDHVGAHVRTYLVADESALPTVLYQVPVVARATASTHAHPDQVIGSPDPGTTLVDGPADPAYRAALLSLLLGGRSAHGPVASATGIPDLALDAHAAYDGAALSGEQSNTSVVYRPADGGMPLICKVYRQVHAGLNPDIELASALAESGSHHVPRFVGSVVGSWPDLATAQGRVSGSLAFAQEFLPGVEDAWRVALRAAANGEDFGAQARDLGRATAEVHVALARLFPTAPTGPAERAVVEDGWRRRLSTAIAEVPAVATYRHAIEAVYRRATQVPWPIAQRIHGDYHLGQVLDVPGRGWVLLDFEGEPLRPMVERTLPDLALRDVAGMLRSFDYVAGSIRVEIPQESSAGAAEWAAHAGQAFLAGYADAAGTDLTAAGPLVAALELDKAVYETIYESRNRPTWVAIPLRAIDRLTGGADLAS